MLKKVGWAAVVLLGLGVVLGNTRLGSLACTSWQRVKTNAKQQVPVEFELERIRTEVAKLVPDMKKNLSAIAAEMVAIDALKEDIASTRTRLDQKKRAMLGLTEELENGKTQLVYGGRTYSRTRLEQQLTADLASYKRCESELKSKEQLLDAKEQSLEAARTQLAEMREQKRELEVQIAQLEAEVKTVRLAQSRCKIQMDDSRLAEIKESLAEVRTRLKVEKTTAELQGEFANDTIPYEKAPTPTTDVTKEVRSYFNTEKVANNQ